MKYAIKNKWITENPFSEVKLPTKLLTVEEIENDPIEEKFFENEELAEFLLTAKEHGLYLDNEIFHLLAFSGLRPGELCTLKDSDFFFETNEIRVTKTLYYPNNMRLASLTPPKTTGSVRRFDVIDTIMAALEKHSSKWISSFASQYYDSHAKIIKKDFNQEKGNPSYFPPYACIHAC